CSHASLSKPRFLKGCAGLPGALTLQWTLSTCQEFSLDISPLFSFRHRGLRGAGTTPDPVVVADCRAASLLDRSQAIPRYHATELHWPQLRVCAAWPS